MVFNLYKAKIHALFITRHLGDMIVSFWLGVQIEGILRGHFGAKLSTASLNTTPFDTYKQVSLITSCPHKWSLKGMR